jgi:hypothetical protein
MQAAGCWLIIIITMNMAITTTSLFVINILLSPWGATALSTTHKKPASIGEAIQVASTQDDLLEIASQLWLPTDENLPSYYRVQQIHHEKRQRWSAQLLEKLSSASLSPTLTLSDDRLERALLGASTSFADGADRPDKEGRSVRQALLGLHTLMGYYDTANVAQQKSPVLVGAVEQLIARAEAMAPLLPLPHVVEMRFAAKGLISRLMISPKLSSMDERVVDLPFDIAPAAINWNALIPEGQSPVRALREAIPFHFDTINTRSGSSVVERRGTAWVAEEGIGALAYSGKLMTPQPMPQVVSDSMRAVEALMKLPSPYFDCALCNHYPDADAACKFHTDPEHGTVWERLNCVVAAGDCRRFAFRPIPGVSKWKDWDPVKGDHADETEPAVIHLFSGDIVQMWGSCNDAFHHAVYTAEGDHATSPDGRVSLVLKRSMDRGGGKRGHGLQGEGRRSKRKPNSPSQVMPRKQGSGAGRTSYGKQRR